MNRSYLRSILVVSILAAGCGGKFVESGEGDPNVADRGAAAAACVPGARQCLGHGVQACDANGMWGAAVACGTRTPFFCSGAGVCGVSNPSCNGLAATCGASGDVDCCASSVVPGGTFNPSSDANNPVTVSDFRLDNYEVTVGRFRKFVAAYSQNIIPAGAGRNVNNAADPGWQLEWNACLPADRAGLQAAVKCNSTYQTWTTAAGANEHRPINCVNWYEAQAFCTWDGGRLPTEAEWDYAAAGGSEQRVYPWGPTVPGANASLAVYGCYYSGSSSCEALDIAPVGSVTAGNGKWGQSDLAGNLREWTQDRHDPGTLNSCSNSTIGMLRGGDFASSASTIASANRYGISAPDHGNYVGLRCARTR